jgi:hypothetical protein
MVSLPFLTAYDPAASSEGTLDPLGLYQIADQLATRLVPGVRERMQRIRFLTAMCVGGLVTENLEANREYPDVAPFLVWEWLLVEAMVRSLDGDGNLWGVPGTQVTRRALREHGYLDARSYLKTPRIFGFHGVYKRLSSHIGLIDLHLSPLPESERLTDAWARDAGLGGLRDARELFAKWRKSVERSMSQKPPRTRTYWNQEQWSRLATLLSPDGAGRREKKRLRELLHSSDERTLGALPAIWELQEHLREEEYSEESLHAALRKRRPSYGPLLDAIRAYERFCRSLTDALNILLAEGATADIQGLTVAALGNDKDFRDCVQGVDDRFAEAQERIFDIDSGLAALFSERFDRFAEPMEADHCAAEICRHHEAIQAAKGFAGKRPWFDRLSSDRIYVRHRYRQPRSKPRPDRYVHDYRGWPIRRFYFDVK